MNVTGVDNPCACQERCYATRDCEFWAYDKAGRLCRLRYGGWQKTTKNWKTKDYVSGWGRQHSKKSN